MKRRIHLSTLVRLAGLWLGLALICGSGEVTTIKAASIAGTATVSGTVTSPKPFKAARVYIRNHEKRMVYMVYTSGGHYRAVDLFPGNYEISVETKGLESDTRNLALEAGQNANVDLVLKDTSADPSRRPGVEYLPYDKVYPAAPALAVAKRTCISCHGPDFLPSRHWSATQWNAAIDMMSAKAGSGGAMLQPKDMSDQEREALVQYLAENFGPGSKARAVQVDIEMPVDETKIAKAMYVEYYLAPDPPGQGIHSPEYANLDNPWAKRRVGQDVHFDGQGNVWLTDRGYPHRLVKLNPSTGEMKDYLVPDPKGGIHDLNIDKDGMIWFAEHQGLDGSQVKHLNMFNPKTEKWEARYPIDPDNVLKFSQKWAQSLAIDSKGNIYVGWISGSAVSRWDRETKKVTVYPLPTAFGSVYGVIADKNDNIWVAEWHASKIAKLDTKTFQWTEYVPPTHPVVIRRLNVDSQNNIWFGEYSAGRLGKLDQSTGKITEYILPHQNSQPYDVFEHQGNIWIADAGQGGTLIKFNPQNKSFTYYPSPQRADKPKIQVTRDGAIWYSPRSSMDHPGFGVLYPDMDDITTFAAYY
jgi:streptogramin lyase/mono/diheme cytochrome c family protein